MTEKNSCFNCTKHEICIASHTIHKTSNETGFAKNLEKLLQSIADNCQYYNKKEE
jgi:hypothetical protein